MRSIEGVRLYHCLLRKVQVRQVRQLDKSIECEIKSQLNFSYIRSRMASDQYS